MIQVGEAGVASGNIKGVAGRVIGETGEREVKTGLWMQV